LGLELEAHAELKAAGRGDGCDLAEGAGGFDGVDAGGVLVVEDVECAGGEAEAGSFFIFVGSDCEIVSPAQVEVDIGRHGLRIAGDAVGARVEEVVTISVGAGEDGPRGTGIGEDTG